MTGELAELVEALADEEEVQTLRWARMIEIEDEMQRERVEWRERLTALNREWLAEQKEWSRARDEAVRLARWMDKVVSS